MSEILLTVEQAKKLYIDAGGPSDHSESEWADIRREIQGIVNAKSDRAGGATIEWWGCWDERYTATGFAKRVRNGWDKQEKQRRELL